MKTGILFEGGAARTIYSCGIMDRFLEADIMPDYIIGVSAGITYAASYISKQKGRNLEMLTKYANDPRYTGIKNIFDPKNKAYYGLRFVYDTIPNKLLPFDYDTFVKFPGEAKAVVTNAETGEAEFFDIMPKENRTKILIATCALPLLFPIVKINGNLYMDGGIADSIPYKKAFEDGCDRLIVVLTREAGYRKTSDPSIDLACYRYKEYPKFCEALRTRAERYNQTIAELEELEKRGAVLIFRPTVSSGFHRLERNIAKIGAMYADGYDHASKRLDETDSFFKK